MSCSKTCTGQVCCVFLTHVENRVSNIHKGVNIYKSEKCVRGNQIRNKACSGPREHRATSNTGNFSFVEEAKINVAEDMWMLFGIHRSYERPKCPVKINIYNYTSIEISVTCSGTPRTYTTILSVGHRIIYFSYK